MATRTNGNKSRREATGLCPNVKQQDSLSKYFVGHGRRRSEISDRRLPWPTKYLLRLSCCLTFGHSPVASLLLLFPLVLVAIGHHRGCTGSCEHCCPCPAEDGNHRSV